MTTISKHNILLLLITLLLLHQNKAISTLEADGIANPNTVESPSNMKFTVVFPSSQHIQNTDTLKLTFPPRVTLADGANVTCSIVSL